MSLDTCGIQTPLRAWRSQPDSNRRNPDRQSGALGLYAIAPWSPWGELNSRYLFRRQVLYPLSYRDIGWPSRIRTDIASVNSGVSYQLDHRPICERRSCHLPSQLLRQEGSLRGVGIEPTASSIAVLLLSTGAIERNRTATITLATSCSAIKLQSRWSG